MGLQGRLSEFPVTDIIQMVSLSKQTGVAEITNATYNNRQVSGRIYFRNGSIVHAALEDMQAMEAVLTFFQFENGDFQFINGETSDREEIRSSNEIIVMQGVNQADEWRTIRQILPTSDVVPLLVDNPQVNGPGINLRPEEWRLLTFINGQDDARSIARKSGLGEFKTSKILVHLLQLGLVEKKQRNLKYILYAELDQLAITQLGTTAKNLLDQSYQRLGLSVESDISYEQAQDVVNNFQKLARLLVGPGRANALSEQMRERVRKLFEG